MPRVLINVLEVHLASPWRAFNEEEYLSIRKIQVSLMTGCENSEIVEKKRRANRRMINRARRFYGFFFLNSRGRNRFAARKDS